MIEQHSARLAGFSAALALAAAMAPAAATAQENAWHKAASDAVEPISAEVAKAFPGIAREGKGEFMPFVVAIKAAGLGKPQAPFAGNPGGVPPGAARGERSSGGPEGGGRGGRPGGGGGPDMSASDVEFVTSLDANRDGQVSLEEIQGAVGADLKKSFDRKASLDTDADGKISKKEYANSMPRKFGEIDEYGLDGHARGHFKQEDRNEDGELSLEEVAGPVIARATGRARAIHLASRLALADKDHDKSLSVAELQAAVAGTLNKAEAPWKGLTFEADSVPVESLYRTLSRLSVEDAEKLERSLKP